MTLNAVKTLISRFRDQPFLASSNKDDAIRNMVGLCKGSGYSTHAHQAGALEEELCTSFSRLHYWSSDIKRGPERIDRPNDDAVVMMADVDYYVFETPLPLEYAAKPIVMYTLDLTKPGYTHKNRTVTTTKNRVKVTVATRQFEHELWEYQQDDIVLINFGDPHKRCGFLGINILKYHIRFMYVEQHTVITSMYCLNRSMKQKLGIHG